MKNYIKYIFLFSIFHLPWSIFHAQAQFGAMPPFVFDIAPVNANLPGFHSFAFAQSGSKWLIVSGRTNGLHGMSSNDGFDPLYANNNMVVIDTTTWQVYYSSLNVLPKPIADPLRSSNAQFFADTTYLYILGGYGRDSTLNQFVTFPTLSAIHIDNMINAVINNTAIAPHIRQLVDTNFRVCGGELGKINNDYYLAFGQNFSGRYTDPPTPLFTQVYANRIKKFNINDNGTTITISNLVLQSDTNNFHRRDLNLVPEILPSGTASLEAFGGVFQKVSQIPWQEPITIQTSGTTVHTYQQVMSQYTCANIPIYDSITQKMYVTFFGGISLNDYIPTINAMVQDILVPFISDVTTFRKDANGFMEETVLPLQLPGLLGTNAQFVPRKDIVSYANGVIRFRSLPAQRTLVGYLLGGIRASGTNLLPTTANDTVYRLFITADLSAGIIKNSNINFLNVFPNPFNGTTRIQFSLIENENVEIDAYDLAGKKVEELSNKKYNSGMNQFDWHTSLSSGMYFLRFTTQKENKVIKIIVN